MKRILIIRTDRLGDVIMVTPMVRELRRTFPDAFLAVLTTPVNSGVFLHNPHLDVVITDDLRKETFWNVVKLLRHNRFTDGLLVLPTERAVYQMLFAGIRNRITVGHKLYGVITLTKGVSRHKYIPLRHEANYCMDLARKIGVVTDNILPEMFVTDKEKQRALNILKQKGISVDDTKIVIHAGTGGSSPTWSDEKFLRLIDEIIKKCQNPNVKIILTAKEMGQSFISAAMALSPGRIASVDREHHDLRDLVGFIAIADVVIAPSTGPEHIADALNIRTIGLHCHRPMNCATIWGTLNNRSVNLEVSDEYCQTHCSADQNSCAFEDGISIDQVIDTLMPMLQQKNGTINPDVFNKKQRTVPTL